jgi:hypothetical protein
MKNLFFTIIVLFISCAENKQSVHTKETSFTEFKDTLEIKTNIKYFKQNVQADKLFIVDNIMIVTQNWIDNGFYIKYFDINSLEFIGQAARKGKGPDEISMGAYPSVDPQGKHIYICDNARNRTIYKFDIQSSIKNPFYKPIKLFEIGTTILDVENITYCGHNKFMYYCHYGSHVDSVEYSYTFVNNSGEHLGNYIESLYYTKLPEGAIKGIGFRSDYYYDDKIITAFEYQDRIIGFDTKENKPIFETKGPILEEPDFEIHGEYWVPFETPRVLTYLSVTANEKYIFALYSGVYETIKNHAPRFSKQIFVFDTHGQPKKLLQLDRTVRNIAYDKEQNKLVCIQNDEDTGTKTRGIVYVNLDDYGL